MAERWSWKRRLARGLAGEKLLGESLVRAGHHVTHVGPHALRLHGPYHSPPLPDLMTAIHGRTIWYEVKVVGSLDVWIDYFERWIYARDMMREFSVKTGTQVVLATILLREERVSLFDVWNWSSLDADVPGLRLRFAGYEREMLALTPG